MVDNIENPFVDEDELKELYPSDLRENTDENSADDSERTVNEQEADADVLRDEAANVPNSGSERGSKRVSRYRRRIITDKDLDVLTFIARFKFASEKQLTLLMDVTRKTVYKRLMGLREIGMCKVHLEVSPNRVWSVTGKALQWLAEAGRIDINDVTEVKDISSTTLGHTLAINQTALWLMRGHPTRDDLPPELPMPYAIDAFVSEYQIRSAWGAFKARNRDKIKMHGEGYVGSIEHDRVWRGADNNSVKELHARFPFLWTISLRHAGNKHAKHSHVPDLVVSRESMREGGEPVSYAFEIELNAKNRGETADILRSFKEDETRYDHVFWVVSNAAVKRHIQREDEGIGMLESGRMHFIPLLNNNGDMLTDPAWRL